MGQNLPGLVQNQTMTAGYDRWGVAWWDYESDESIEIDFIPLP